MRRLDANRRILARLNEMVEAWPDWRFHQLLQNCDCSICGADHWYEESDETLQRMEDSEMIRKLGARP